MWSKVRAVIVHTLGPCLCLLNPRKTSAGFYAIFVQLLLNDNSYILQLKIERPLTPFPIPVLSNVRLVPCLFPVRWEHITNNVVFPHI